MAIIETDKQIDFHDALAAPGRSPEIPEAADVFGWFVGDWELDIHRYWSVDVRARGIKGEIHVGWVLEGRAIQDVWIMPPRPDRTGKVDKKLNMYGSTLRAWDPTIQAWRIVWVNPAGDHYEQQVARWSGKDVVQVGARCDGTTTRWTFSEIKGDAFHWTGEALAAAGRSWTLEGDFRARRR